MTTHNKPTDPKKSGQRVVKLVLFSLLLAVAVYQLYTEPSLAAAFSVLETLALFATEL